VSKLINEQPLLPQHFNDLEVNQLL